jgi:glycine/D-amino acid oxidase-like deaminating enzyme
VNQRQIIAGEKASLARSLWAATAGPQPDRAVLTGKVSCDVAVVGAGYTGLSAALHCAEQGLASVVIEAQTPGWGASGRNGGQVIPGLKFGVDEVTRLFGADLGLRFARLGSSSADVVFDLIARHGIECRAERNGWLSLAHDERAAGSLGVRQRQARELGADVEVLDEARTAELVGAPLYAGALLDRRGGAVHPLRYAQGLATAAEHAGVQLYVHSPVRRLSGGTGRFELETPNGSVRARTVLLCANGYTDRLVPALQRSIIPVCSIQIATARLSDKVLGAILPERHIASDTGLLTRYFRVDVDRRFVMGGRGAYGDAGLGKQAARLRRAAETLFPQIRGTKWDFQWGGFIAMTKDHLPHLHEIEPGLFTGLGYNGRGVGMATVMGKMLAALASGEDRASLDMPVTGLKSLRGHTFHQPVVSGLIAWYGLQDRLRRRKGRAI